MTEIQQSSLNPKQRELLELVSSRFRDPETFEECHPGLKETGLYLTQSQLFELRNAFFVRSRWQHSEDFRKLDEALHSESGTITAERLDHLADAVFNRSFEEEKREFAQLDGHFQKHGLSLTAEQMKQLREALLVCSREEQRRDFAAINERMRDSSMALPGDMLIRLGDHLFARSRAEHLAEFEKTDGRLQAMPETQAMFVPFETEPQPLEVPVEALDAIPAPKIIDADHTPLDVIEEKRTALNELRKHSEKEGGIIGRVADAINYKAGPAGTRPVDVAAALYSPENMFAIMLIILVVLGGFILPGWLSERAAGRSAKISSAREMQIIDAQDEQDSAEIKKILTPDGEPDNQKGASIAVPVPQAQAPATEVLLPEVEDTVPARISRIQALLKAKKRTEAQKLCIATMKRKLTKTQFDALWMLMRQSMQI